MIAACDPVSPNCAPRAVSRSSSWPTLRGVKQVTISKLENHPGAGDPATLSAVAEALGVRVDELTSDEPLRTDHSASGRPSMAAVPGWAVVLERAKLIAPDVDSDAWAMLEAAPGLLSSDLPLTPAVVADLGRLVMRHAPVRKK